MRKLFPTSLILLLVLTVCVVPSTYAATVVWDGPEVEFVHPAFSGTAVADCIVPEVCLTRGVVGGLLNGAENETMFNAALGSPIGTQWAFATLNGNGPVSAVNHAALMFANWAVALGGQGILTLPTNILSNPGVLMLEHNGDQIFIDIMFTEWGVGLPFPGEGGSFAYLRSGAPVVVPLPAALPLFAGALFGMGLTRRRVG